jgi:CDP-diacylglycerol--glycerol-3-phosphate 3-phosphatidyltransferase
MFDGPWRSNVDRALVPVGRKLNRVGLTADVLTGVGLISAGVAAVAIGSGATRLGFVMVLLAAVPDLLDGALAKAAGTAGPRGAFFDSVADRVTDALLFGGVAWYLQSKYGGHMALLGLAVLASSSIISYERAKAELLGFEARGGLMERAERVILLCFGLLFSFLLLPVLWIMLALTLVTAVERFVKVWFQATPTRGVPERAAERRARRASRRTPRASVRSWRRSDGRRRSS